MRSSTAYKVKFGFIGVPSPPQTICCATHELAPMAALPLGLFPKLNL